MTYGLEVFELTAKEVHQLEKFQRSTLRLIKNFPINTAICAVYGLLGIKPMQQELDLRKLTLLGNVLSNRDSIEYQIAQRQLAVKSLDSKSWSSSCNRLLYKYGLPNLYNADKTFESMEKWKSAVAIFVRYGIDFSDLKLQNNHPNLEIAGIKIHGPKDHIAIINLYKPGGRTHVSEREYLDIFGNINDNIILLGDFNAHNRLWEPHCTMDDASSKEIIDLINTKGLVLLNDGSPTRHDINAD